MKRDKKVELLGMKEARPCPSRGLYNSSNYHKKGRSRREHKNIGEAMLDQANGLFSPTLCGTQWPKTKCQNSSLGKQTPYLQPCRWLIFIGHNSGRYKMPLSMCKVLSFLRTQTVQARTDTN